MTPTLLGRLQTRILLNVAIGIPILFLFKSLPVIFIMLPLGLLWDYLYDFLEHKRWDGDWPLIFTFLSGITEGISFYVILNLFSNLGLNRFAVIYIIIWFPTFLAQTGVLNTLFPYRRFNGGRIL